MGGDDLNDACHGRSVALSEMARRLVCVRNTWVTRIQATINRYRARLRVNTFRLCRRRRRRTTRSCRSPLRGPCRARPPNGWRGGAGTMEACDEILKAIPGAALVDAEPLDVCGGPSLLEH